MDTSRVAVAVRMRPLNDKENESGIGNGWCCLPNYNSVTQCVPSTEEPVPETAISFFTFDKVFGPAQSTQEVYDEMVKPVVQSGVNGLNGIVFAYGQTSSGKTFTMSGEDDSPGLIHMANDEIFQAISEAENREFLLRVSFLEVYNEQLRDMLDPENKPLIKEDPKKGVYVQAKERVVTGYDDIIEALEEGKQSCVVAVTEMNERSSRSHSIFRLIIESKKVITAPEVTNATGDGCLQVVEQDPMGQSMEGSADAARDVEDADLDGTSVLVGTLNFVDLAGSESIRLTGVKGDRAKEGGKINQSLLALSRVINSLGQADNTSSHVNYRDSKLTRVLQPALSGNSLMTMICCCTGYACYIEETRSTLQFASRAKLIKTRAVVNEVLDDRAQIRKLKNELRKLKAISQIAQQIDDGMVSKLEADKEELERAYQKQEQKIYLLKHCILQGGSLKEENRHQPFATPPRNAKTFVKKSKKSKVRQTWCPGDADCPFPILELNVNGPVQADCPERKFTEDQSSEEEDRPKPSNECPEGGLMSDLNETTGIVHLSPQDLSELHSVVQSLGGQITEEVDGLGSQLAGLVKSLIEKNKTLEEELNKTSSKFETLSKTTVVIEANTKHLTAQKSQLESELEVMKAKVARLDEERTQALLQVQTQSAGYNELDDLMQLEIENEKTIMKQKCEILSDELEEMQHKYSDIKLKCAEKDQLILTLQSENINGSKENTPPNFCEKKKTPLTESTKHNIQHVGMNSDAKTSDEAMRLIFKFIPEMLEIFGAQEKYCLPAEERSLEKLEEGLKSLVVQGRKLASTLILQPPHSREQDPAKSEQIKGMKAFFGKVHSRMSAQVAAKSKRNKELGEALKAREAQIAAKSKRIKELEESIKGSETQEGASLVEEHGKTKMKEGEASCTMFDICGEHNPSSCKRQAIALNRRSLSASDQRDDQEGCMNTVADPALSDFSQSEPDEMDITNENKPFVSRDDCIQQGRFFIFIRNELIRFILTSLILLYFLGQMGLLSFSRGGRTQNTSHQGMTSEDLTSEIQQAVGGQMD